MTFKVIRGQGQGQEMTSVPNGLITRHAKKVTFTSKGRNKIIPIFHFTQ